MMVRKSIASLIAALVAMPALSAPPPSLTPAGYGPVRMEMTMDQVERALGVKLRRPTAEDIDLFGTCHDTGVIGDGYPGMSFMFDEGTLVRIALHPVEEGQSTSTVKTPRGIGLGASEADVKRLYGPSLIVTTAEYDEEPAHSLLFWLKSGESGVRFVTTQKGVVNRIYAGSSAIELIEGCA